MNHLVDTHALIWFLNGDLELSDKARAAIESNESINYISIASLWEIAIKVSVGKLELNIPFSKLAEFIEKNGFRLLPITFNDTIILTNLPFHHRDPFDRLIISQSINNQLAIISKDTNFKSYQVSIIW